MQIAAQNSFTDIFNVSSLKLKPLSIKIRIRLTIETIDINQLFLYVYRLKFSDFIIPDQSSKDIFFQDDATNNKNTSLATAPLKAHAIRTPA